MKSLHTSLNTAHSECKPSPFMSSSTHSFHVFLFLLHLAPATSTFLQADTQSSTLLLYAPDAQTTSNLLCLTTFATFCKPKRLYKSTLRFLSFSDTHTSISPSSALSSTDYRIYSHVNREILEKSSQSNSGGWRLACGSGQIPGQNPDLLPILMTYWLMKWTINTCKPHRKSL